MLRRLISVSNGGVVGHFPFLLTVLTAFQLLTNLHSSCVVGVLSSSANKVQTKVSKKQTQTAVQPILAHLQCTTIVDPLTLPMESEALVLCCCFCKWATMRESKQHAQNEWLAATVRESKRHAKNEWLAASLWCSTMYVCLVIAACA